MGKPELPPIKPQARPRLENKLQHTDKVSCSTTRPNLKVLKNPLMELLKRWRPTLESWRMKPEVRLHGIMPTTNTKLRRMPSTDSRSNSMSSKKPSTVLKKNNSSTTPPLLTTHWIWPITSSTRPGPELTAPNMTLSWLTKNGMLLIMNSGRLNSPLTTTETTKSTWPLFQDTMPPSRE